MQNTPKEWALIQKIRYRVQRQNDHTVVPLGDDAFVFKNFPGYSVICQDMMVEDVHFSLDYFSAFDLGYKALAVNLSDIAAMGAQPHFAQVSLALPKKINDSWLDEFYMGMSQLADEHHCEIVGGDLTASGDKLTIDVSIHGSCPKPLTRKGAQPGDLLLSSGFLGLSYTGFIALKKNKEDFLTAKQKHLRPKPRLDLVAELQEKKDKIHALMDCSDGLVNDALQLIPNESGLHIFIDNLPIHEETAKMSFELDVATEDLALWGGEDYELLIAISPDDYDKFQNWKLVGQFTNAPGVFVTYADGKEEIKEFKGWRHF
ncbi:thiamine-phosphate kinase [Bdellovibrio sp. 22V]|uniref:thiamine-phosphate kinase n=1 Tax=Bdellovibrio TaxID=958 RepID=UPI0025434081|nr:thiamine-phosphate kinase [Bdellovibrio sp. 22V]WII71288.1 thiamine-phosphate kinase [Bdellovibrio sp. 22V]